MPRLPKPPGANPPAPISDLLDLAVEVSHRTPVDLLAALAAAGHYAAAEQAVDALGHYSARQVEPLAWMAWCCPDPAQASRWEARARASWDDYVESTAKIPRHIGVAGWSALALLDPDPAPALERAEAIQPTRTERLSIVRVLAARGRLEEAVAMLAQLGSTAKLGMGWSTGVMSRYEDGFMSSLLHRLVSERRWDLLARYTETLVACDGLFLGSICLTEALSGREDAAEALAVLPESFLHACFLPVVASMPPEARPSAAPLVARLPGRRRAVGEQLLGDPGKVDALLQEQGRDWDGLIVAMLRGDEVALGGGAHTLRRAAIGGLRALTIQGDSEARVRWAERLRDALGEIADEADRAHVLAELGRSLCRWGERDLGESMLMEAFVMAEALPRTNQGWTRHNMLERVGCNAIRAGALQASLKSLQKCTSKYRRPNLAGRLAVLYVQAGDIGGAMRLLSFIKPDPAFNRQDAVLRAVEALTPGWTARFNVRGGQ